MGIQRIEEVPYGVYIWITADGRVIMDEDENYLCIFAMRGDQNKIRQLADAARHYGFEGGHPEFLSGRRKVTDEELERQRFRMTMGLTPDEYDIPSLVEDLKNHGRDRS